MARVLGYARASVVEQQITIMDQQQKLAAYCVATSRILADIITDSGESAGSLKRPGVQELIKQIRSGDVSAVIVTKLDRLTRSVADLQELLKLFARHNVALISIGESLDSGSATGRMVLNLMMSVFSWERESAVERTVAALGHQRRSGKVYGSTPFGYRVEGKDKDRRLVPDAAAMKGLARAQKMFAEGKSLRQIGKMLETGGYVSPRGNKNWNPSTVKAMLTSRVREVA